MQITDDQVLKVLEPFAKYEKAVGPIDGWGIMLLSAGDGHASALRAQHIQAAADLHARLSAQAGGEKEEEVRELCPDCKGSKVEFGALSGWPHECRTCNGTGVKQQKDLTC